MHVKPDVFIDKFLKSLMLEDWEPGHYFLERVKKYTN